MHTLTDAETIASPSRVTTSFRRVSASHTHTHYSRYTQLIGRARRETRKFCCPVVWAAGQGGE
ncbi:hypothetical protein BDU57DRAFT_524374 [Ampelomyces quisqualis]|uniref:Uncharacterized protein n=1 Tax=Ampelomyces quisqualis TaxID=50730 RepID=A0A6A5Q9T8_AMPQU|nr:hypothetical protein BDU57DRAFT_524374 [Ampelomyces quisqualis]